jgi:hypothetical protein
MAPVSKRVEGVVVVVNLCPSTSVRLMVQTGGGLLLFNLCSSISVDLASHTHTLHAPNDLVLHTKAAHH